MTYARRLKQLSHLLRLQKLRRFILQNRLFIALLCIFFIFGTIVSIVRYKTYLDGFDYSVFAQTIWHYSQSSAPHSTIRDVNNILGDHFHPLLIVLAPLFWIWNNPIVLTVVQPCMFALSAAPLYLLAKKHLGRNNALLICTAYLASHGLQFALFFDFHEIAMAVPILSLLIYSIDLEKYRRVIICCVLLCLLKEELILLSAMVGIVLILKKKQYKLGTIIFVGSLAFFITLTKLIMPFLAGKGRYNDYWTYDSYGSSFVDLVKNIITKPFKFISDLHTGVFENHTKTGTLWMLVFSSGLSVFFSWYALLALPDLAVRLMSDRGTFYWNYWFHYGAILMPIIFFCLIDVLQKLRKRVPASVITILCAFVCLFNIGVAYNKHFPFSQVFTPQFYSLNSEVRSGESNVRSIVGNSSITAPVVITSHFANRDSIHILTDKGRWYTRENLLLTGKPETDYVIMNEKLPITDVDPSYGYSDLQRDIEEVGYYVSYKDKTNGWVIYNKR